MENGLTPSDVALLNNNDGNSWIWIIALFFIFGMSNGFGNGYQPQYATQDFVQNGFNFNDLQNQNRDILTAITNGTAQAVAATNQAKYDNINVAKDIQAALTAQLNDVRAMEQNIIGNQTECCCNTLRALDGVNYNAAINTASINATTTAQTQKILDALATDKMEAMQNRINQLELQSAMSNVVRYPNGFTYNAGQSPFCAGCCG